MNFSHCSKGFILLIGVTFCAIGKNLLMESGNHKFSLFAKFKRFWRFFVWFLPEDVDEGGKVGSLDIVVFEVFGGLVLPLEWWFEFLDHFGLTFEALVQSGRKLWFLGFDSALLLVCSFFCFNLIKPPSLFLFLLLFFKSFLLLFLLFLSLLSSKLLEFFFC